MLRLQKFAPVDRDVPIYEVVDEAGAVVLDVSTENGELVGYVHGSPEHRRIDMARLCELIDMARKNLAADASAESVE